MGMWGMWSLTSIGPWPSLTLPSPKHGGRGHVRVQRPSSSFCCCSAPWRSRLGVPGSGLFACCCVRGPGLFPRLATRKLLECWMEHAGMIAGMIAGTIAECWHGLGCFRWHDRSWPLRLARLVGGNINRTRGPPSATGQRSVPSCLGQGYDAPRSKLGPLRHPKKIMHPDTLTRLRAAGFMERYESKEMQLIPGASSADATACSLLNPAVVLP